MKPEPKRIRELFVAAVGKADPELRGAFLAEACDGDEGLLGEVRLLLEAHQDAGRFLESPAAAPTVTVASTLTEGPGTVIGPYKLLEQIGEGGMGVVYMAEQARPIRRKVALKIIKPGMDTRQVIARFEAERQALALMDHPNIARVLDAGATDSGRPYFVMELVRGIPITEYCDRNHLAIADRLELFVQVCQAVQHAHQKGIIHRDLKPSNVLVTLIDGAAVPKIIDFGVAKAMGQQLTEKTLFTGFAHLIGTPLYMSPEQAELSGVDIDTRSDIYSLGVLLYELLTGMTPFDAATFRAAAYDEMRRIIREQEPPKPSTRISTLEATATTISANRQTDPRRLRKALRGELDWIVMKCLDKDRNRRYETANTLVADLRRYLNHEPVDAGPPSAWYRLRKTARRNRAALAVTAGAMLVLTVLAYTLVNKWAEVIRQRRAIETALDKAKELGQQAHWTEARVVLEQARDRLAQTEPVVLRRRLEQAIADLDLVDRLEAIRLRRATVVNGGFDYRNAEREYAAALSEAGLGKEGEAAEAVVARFRGSTICEPLVAALDDWAAVTHDPQRQAWLLDVARRADPGPWRDRFRDPKVWRDRAALEALAGELLRDEAQLAQQRPQLMVALGNALQATKADAVPLLVAAQARHPGDFWLNFSLGRALPHGQAVGYCRAALVLRPESAAVHNNLGVALHGTKQLDEAIREYHTAIELDPNYAKSHYNLGVTLQVKNQLEEAIHEYRTALQLDPKFHRAHTNLAKALQDTKQLDEAIREFRKAIEVDPRGAWTHANLGNALLETKQLDEAIREFHAAIELDPKDAAFHYNLGAALVDTKQLDEGIREFRKTIELDPSSAWAHNILGVALREAKQLDEAIHEFRKTIELDPKYAAPHNNLGNALLDTKQLDEGIRELRKAIELDPKDFTAHINLGLGLVQQAKFGEAVTEYREAIRLQPDDARHYYGLAWLLATCADPQFRDPQQAVALAKKAVQLEPQSGNNWNTLGVALYRAGQFAEAIPALERGLREQKGQNDAYSLFFLAMCHHRLGAATKARECRERAANWFQKHKSELTADGIRELSEFQAEADAVVGQPPGQGTK
jgi:serine/threonine protein kinase/Flp pilus assembly protein TadD